MANGDGKDESPAEDERRMEPASRQPESSARAPRAFAPWTAAEDAHVRGIVDDGPTLGELAEILGRTSFEVALRLVNEIGMLELPDRTLYRMDQQLAEGAVGEPFSCELHGEPLRLSRAEILYGLVPDPSLIGRALDRPAEFPNARPVVLGGFLVDDGRWRRRVILACHSCRGALLAWTAEHDPAGLAALERVFGPQRERRRPPVPPVFPLPTDPSEQ